jgi:hypothetical protein
MSAGVPGLKSDTLFKFKGVVRGVGECVCGLVRGLGGAGFAPQGAEDPAVVAGRVTGGSVEEGIVDNGE